MAFGATIFLGTSILGLAALFALKWWELSRGVEYLTSYRRNADINALKLKSKLFLIGEWVQDVPNKSVLILRVLVHAGAVGFAQAARGAEAQAHHVADLVSHRHRFERRETKSEFLKEVSDHKNGLDEPGVDKSI